MPQSCVVLSSPVCAEGMTVCYLQTWCQVNESMVPVGSWSMWTPVEGDLGKVLSLLPATVYPEATCRSQHVYWEVPMLFTDQPFGQAGGSQRLRSDWGNALCRWWCLDGSCSLAEVVWQYSLGSAGNTSHMHQCCTGGDSILLLCPTCWWCIRASVISVF